MLKHILVICCLFMATQAVAQHQLLTCEDCRDVRTYPKDFGNYAFNKLIAPIPDDQFNPFTTYSTSTYVWNRNSQWALVKLDDVVDTLGISFNLSFINVPVEASSEFVRITVQSMYGDTKSYQVLETSQPLVVGDSATAAPPPAPDPDPVQKKAGSYGTGEEFTLCCQSGAFYWYYDQPAFNLRLGNE